MSFNPLIPDADTENPLAERIVQVSKRLLELESTSGSFDFSDKSFKQQLDFINDPAKLKAAFCTRRSAKSYTAALYLLKEAYENPGVTCLYIALTRDSAKRILWKDCLKEINRRYDLDIRFNETSLVAALPNGSEIKLVGVDSNEDEKEKLLGQKYKLVIVDEAASYTIDLKQLIYSTLKPAVADYRGTICLIGTPGNLTKGLYFDITTGKENGWSVHRWTTFDNPYMAKQWQEEINDLVQNHPLIQETPWFKQMYLGQWVIDQSKLVYRFDGARNSYIELPKYSKGKWSHILGVDLGHSPDPTAFTVTAFHPHDPALYVVKSYARLEMDITDVANEIKGLDSEYHFDRMVVDGAAKQAVEEIRRRHSIPLIAADKIGKVDFIEIMNGEMIQGKIKLHVRDAAGLADEYAGLIWHDKTDKRAEHPNCQNNMADSCLYNWRYCYSYLFTELREKPQPNTEAWFQHQVKEMEEAAERQHEDRLIEEMEDKARFGDFGGGFGEE